MDVFIICVAVNLIHDTENSKTPENSNKVFENTRKSL